MTERNLATVTSTTLDGLLDELGTEWAWGVARLSEFERLYGKIEHVALLNSVGAEFFADVQGILWDDLLLRITRLTDPPQSSGRDNLTVRRLPEVCERAGLRVDDLQEQVDTAVRAADFARPHRNQRIGHKDLAYVIGRGELPAATLDKIQGALDAIHAVLQTVNSTHRQASLSQEVSVGPRVEAFLGRTEFLVDSVLFLQELLSEVTDQAPAWDHDVARECIRRLGGTPTPENVRRIVNLRLAALWLRTE